VESERRSVTALAAKRRIPRDKLPAAHTWLFICSHINTYLSSALFI
jgi:hypothetical protein